MEDEDDIFENQVEFLAERDVWNRVGGPDIGIGGVVNLKKSGYTVNEKFRLIAAATIKIMNDFEFEEALTDAQLAHMLTLVEKIPDFQYKNPSAFAMAYVVAINSNYKTIEINKQVLTTVLQINGEIEDKLFSKIDDSDIIRYTRLCLLNNLK
jgi:hypothetical protein